MRPGYAVYIRGVAPFSVRAPAAIAAEIAHLIAGRTPAFVVAIFFGVVLVAQAQESVQEVALPPWSEPTLPSTEPAPSTQAASLPSVTEPVAFYTRGAIALFDCTVAFLRGGIPLFIRSVVFFDELHHSANKCYVGASSRRALRGV